MICFEARPNRYASCPTCGVYIGCYGCVYPRCGTCPQCRAALPGTAPVPQVIPGAKELISIPPIESADVVDGVGEGEDEDADDTLPLVF